MADETPAKPDIPKDPLSDAIAPGVPPVVPPTAITAQHPPAPAPPPKSDAMAPYRSELSQFLGWLGGVFIILGCGWGLIFALVYWNRALHLGIPAQVAGAVGALISAGLFYVLEKDLWLSKFMGLRLGPHSTQITETLFFAVTGIIGLLLRSSDRPTPAASRTPQENDGMREIVETVVFVIVLVLLLKTFVVEAFVIPTGSMADTLLGYHRDFTCEKCHYSFLVNCSGEAEAGGDNPSPVIGGTCPNCGYRNRTR